MKILNYITAVLLIVASFSDTVQARDFKLVWRDDFRGRALDDEKWSRIPRGQSDWRNYMSLHEDLCELKRGKLIIKVVANDGIDPSDTAAFLTGGIYTKDKFSICEG